MANESDDARIVSRSRENFVFDAISMALARTKLAR